ncbi:MAG: T9SS type A sorting domain-containing protein [Flavobacterium sp.]|nr:T9SS type A sorting domain-containing protein [Flavobacterium sp.]
MKKILLLISFVSCNIIFGQSVFQENLASYNTGTQLSGQGAWSNNTALGGGGSCAGAICTNASVLNQGFTYLNYGSSPNSLELNNDKDSCGRLFTAQTGITYFGFMVNLTSAATSPNDSFRVLSGSAFNIAFRMYIKTVTSSTFVIGISKGSGATSYTTNSYAFSQDHLLIFKYSQLSGTADDLVSLYVDPVIANGVPAVADVSTAVGTDATGNIDRLHFRQSTNSIPVGRAGLISVAKSWTGLILGTNQIEKPKFVLVSSEIPNGILLINSNQIFEKADLKIYGILGNLIDSKTISLSENENQISINPIQSSGFYVVEITDNTNFKFSQKIIIE